MDLVLDDNHDLLVTNSDLSITTDDNSVVQSLKIRLQFILNEWFLDVTAGLPYPTVIFEKGTNISTIYSLYRKEIIETLGVKELVSLNLTPDNDNKSLRVDFSVTQDSGSTLSEQIILEV
jgi:hypothetical protein